MELWSEAFGAGPDVLFVHGGLGDSRLWEPVARLLAGEFRCILYDTRHFGRSTGPGGEWSSVEDAVAVLDRHGVERAAVVGLSMGGRIALDLALAHPERVYAIAHVAGAVSGLGFEPSVEEAAAWDEAEATGDVEAMMALDLAMWAPLGVEPLFRELWLATPDARGLPEGARPKAPPPAAERLGEIAVPTLVIVPDDDPAPQREIEHEAARRIPGARLATIDSDHYLTVREPERVAALLREFLTTAS